MVKCIVEDWTLKEPAETIYVPANNKWVGMNWTRKLLSLLSLMLIRKMFANSSSPLMVVKAPFDDIIIKKTPN